MSPTSIELPFLFQSLMGKNIAFTSDEQSFIKGLEPLEGGEWEGKIKPSSTIRRTDRDAMVTAIKTKLLAIQGDYCIYCGLHEKYCGSKLQREHIAHKGKDGYPTFMFEPFNLCLACYRCNCELKNDLDIASGNKTTYSENEFIIIHPYFDEINNELDIGVSTGQGIIKVKNKSIKGIKTIELFELDSVHKTLQRCGLIRAYEEKTGIKYEDAYHQITGNKYVSK